MKAPRNFFARALSVCLLIGAAALSGWVGQTQAQIVTLASGNSVARVDAGNQAGMFYWSVDGVSQLAQQWFWYRTANMSSERSIDTISPPSISLPSANKLTTTYANPLYNIRVDYTLTGGLLGSGNATIVENILINNTSGSPLSLSFFQYSDFDLAGTPLGDEVQLGKNQSGKFNEALQTEGNISLSEYFATGANTPGADHGEAAFHPQTLTGLNDLGATTLNDAMGPLGPGNVTWAFQWDLVIAAGSSAEISKTKFLQVPEPTTIALGSLGLIACFFRKQRGSR